MKDLKGQWDMCKKVSENLIYTQTSLGAERFIYHLGDITGFFRWWPNAFFQCDQNWLIFILPISN